LYSLYYDSNKLIISQRSSEIFDAFVIEMNQSSLFNINHVDENKILGQIFKLSKKRGQILKIIIIIIILNKKILSTKKLRKMRK